MDYSWMDDYFSSEPEPKFLPFQELDYGSIFEIALYLPFEQLRYRCVYDKSFKILCSYQEFWKRRLKIFYSDLFSYKPVDMTYGQYYTALEEENIKTINVLYNERYIGRVLMFYNDKESDIYYRARDLLEFENVYLDPNLMKTILEKGKRKIAGSGILASIQFGYNMWSNIIDGWRGEPGEIRLNRSVQERFFDNLGTISFYNIKQ